MLLVLVSVSEASVSVLGIVVVGAARDAPVLIVEKGRIAIDSLRASTCLYMFRCNFLSALSASLNRAVLVCILKA